MGLHITFGIIGVDHYRQQNCIQVNYLTQLEVTAIFYIVCSLPYAKKEQCESTGTKNAHKMMVKLTVNWSPCNKTKGTR